MISSAREHCALSGTNSPQRLPCFPSGYAIKKNAVFEQTHPGRTPCDAASWLNVAPVPWLFPVLCHGVLLLIAMLLSEIAVAETPSERGAYLVRGIAGCGNCHTPRSDPPCQLAFTGVYLMVTREPLLLISGRCRRSRKNYRKQSTKCQYRPRMAQ